MKCPKCEGAMVVINHKRVCKNCNPKLYKRLKRAAEEQAARRPFCGEDCM